MYKRIEDCVKGKVLNPITNKCIPVDRLKPGTDGYEIATYLDFALDTYKQHYYTGDKNREWKKKPGSKGFNKYVKNKLKKISKKLYLECNPDNPKSFAYQDTVSFCLQPGSSIKRMLVIHRTGAGKTRTIVKILENFYNDHRPKILIFPTQETTNNFYKEIISFDNRYYRYVEHNIQNVREKINKDYSKTLSKIKDLLAQTGNLGQYKKQSRGASGATSGILAPLRAYRYSVAGGSSIFKGNTPNDPIFKLNYVQGQHYSNKIIIMDEIHNLVAPSGNLIQYRSKLNQLKKALESCKGSILVGMTATPNVKGLNTGKELLKIIKGPGPASRNNEGYISYFNELPQSIYPKITTSKLKVRIKKQHVSKKSKPPESNYDAYVKALSKNKKDFKRYTDKELLKMCNYINMGGYYASVNTWLPKFKDDPKHWSVKFHEIIKSVNKLPNNKKTLILCNRAAGFKGLVKAFQTFGNKKFNFAYDLKDSVKIARFSKKDNKEGKVVQVMIADSSQFGEGVSFLGVRQLYIVNPPLNYASFRQLQGRVLRACGHHNLSKSNRTVDIKICRASVDGAKSVDEFLMKRLKKEEKVYQKEMSFFKDLAIDKGLF